MMQSGGCKAVSTKKPKGPLDMNYILNNSNDQWS